MGALQSLRGDLDIPVLLDNRTHGLILKLETAHNANLMIELIHELRVLAELIFAASRP